MYTKVLILIFKDDKIIGHYTDGSKSNIHYNPGLSEKDLPYFKPNSVVSDADEAQDLKDFNNAIKTIRLTGDYSSQTKEINDFISKNKEVLSRRNNYDRFNSWMGEVKPKILRLPATKQEQNDPRFKDLLRYNNYNYDSAIKQYREGAGKIQKQFY